MDELNASQSDLTNFIATVIRECRDNGMVMPFLNGSVVVNRVGSGDVEPLVEHYEDGVPRPNDDHGRRSRKHDSKGHNHPVTASSLTEGGEIAHKG